MSAAGIANFFAYMGNPREVSPYQYTLPNRLFERMFSVLVPNDTGTSPGVVEGRFTQVRKAETEKHRER